MGTFGKAAVGVVLVMLSFVMPAEAEDATAQSPAAQFVQGIGDHALAIMADQSLSPAQRSQQYRAILQQSFDMPTIARFVLGRAWNTATPQQRDAFVDLFERRVLDSYADALNFYTGEKFRVDHSRPETERDTVVNSSVLHADNSQPTKIDWRVRAKEGGNFAVLDVVVEGVSQSVTQRQQYSAILQRNGGDMDALLDMMKKSTNSKGS